MRSKINDLPVFLSLMTATTFSTKSRTDTGRTSIHPAVNGAHSVTSVFKCLTTKVSYLFRQGNSADAIDECCRTPLYIAVKYGDVELATMLLEEGKANPDLLSLSKVMNSFHVYAKTF